MEKIDNILREMRKDMPRVVDAKVILRNYADRIEAALKHETVKNCHALNAVKMREALKMFVDAYKTTSYTLCLENLRPAFQKRKPPSPQFRNPPNTPKSRRLGWHKKGANDEQL